MTVSSTTKRNSYTGNGSTTTFAYSFKIFDDDDITVILRTTATGTETVQTKTTHYSVTGVGSASGGNVVFGSAPTSAQTVVLLRQTAQTQATDYTPNDPFPAASHEDALDKLTLMTQDQQDELDRSIKLSRTNTMTSTEFTVGATDRANKILAFDSSGELSVTQELGTNRGDWAASTSYNQRDIVKDTSTGNIFFVNEAHTSSGSQPLTTNTNSSKYDLLIESLFSGVTAGTVSASKGVLVDGNKDITGFRNITLSGELTLGSGAVINEAELEAIDGVTAGTVAASKAVVVDSNKDAASFRNITLTGELDAGSLDVSGDADIDGTLEADAMTLNGTAITATATLDTGISNNNVPKFTSGVADNDFLRVDGTAIEGRSASEVLSDIAAAPAAGDSNIVTTGALNSGSITSGFGAIDNGSSNITTTGVGTFGSLDISGDIDVDGTTNLDVVDIDGAVDMASTLGVAGVVTANAGVVVDNFTLDGTTLSLSSGDMTLDVEGEFIVDVNLQGEGNGVLLKDAGILYGNIFRTSSDLVIMSSASDEDLLFKGNDGGSTITALTLDMSEAGAATFNAGATFSSGNLLVGKTADNVATVGIEARGTGPLISTRDGSDALRLNRLNSDGEIIQLRKDGTTVGSIITLSSAGAIGIFGAGGSGAGLVFQNNDIIQPGVGGVRHDDSQDLGSSSFRFDNIFATNGTIQTSDENEKQNIASLTSAEITAAKAISKLFKTFKWKSKVTAKGDAARTHTGVIAQEVQAAMSDAGLDATKYAFWCSDTWWETSTEVAAVKAVEAADAVYDDDGKQVSPAVEAVEAKDAYTRVDTYHTEEKAPEGATKRTRLGVRYPELLAFIGAATEQRLADIETRLAALEAG